MQDIQVSLVRKNMYCTVFNIVRRPSIIRQVNYTCSTNLTDGNIRQVNCTCSTNLTDGNIRPVNYTNLVLPTSQMVFDSGQVEILISAIQFS